MRLGPIQLHRKLYHSFIALLLYIAFLQHYFKLLKVYVYASNGFFSDQNSHFLGCSGATLLSDFYGVLADEIRVSLSFHIQYTYIFFPHIVIPNWVDDASE